MRNKAGFSVLIVACAILSVGYGLRQSLGLFVGPLGADRGWSLGAFALAFALQNLIWGIAQPFAGAFADRFGARITVAVGGIAYALGLVVMAVARDPVVYAWVGGIVLGIGLAAASYSVLMGPAASVVVPERRAVALGILGAGGSLGQTFYPPIAQIGIGLGGWPAGLAILAAASLALVPLAWFLREGRRAPGPADQTVMQAVREALAHPSFVLLVAGFFVCGFHIAFFQTHLPNIVARAAIPASFGALALAIVGVFNVFGSYFSGVLGGRFPRRYVLSAIYAMRALVFAVFAVLPITALGVVVFAAALGFLWLSTIPPTSAIVAEKFGLQWVSTLFGIAFFSHQVGAFFGAWLGAVVLERTGSYDMMWWLCIALGVAAALLNLTVDERPVPRLAGIPATVVS